MQLLWPLMERLRGTMKPADRQLMGSDGMPMATDREPYLAGSLQLDPRALLDASPMSAAQVRGVIIVAILSALDGYDVLAMTFSAPSISASWSLDKTSLGLALASGVAGMALGSIFVAPLADRLGRRNMIVANLLLMSFSMIAAMLSRGLSDLVICRLITGVGIGAMVPIITPLASEFANARWRALAIGSIAIGYPLGGTIGGFGAAALLQWFDWRAVFLVGGALSAILVPVALAWLPESPSFLLKSRGSGALDRANAMLLRFEQPRIASMPLLEADTVAVPYKAIFARGQLRATLMITIINFFFIMTVYYVHSWLPQLVADAGHSPSFGSLVSACTCFAGLLACVGLGVFGPEASKQVLVPVQLIGFGLTTVAFGFAPTDAWIMLVSGSLVGVFLYSSVMSLYAMIVTAFDVRMRTTGAGFVMGLGRIGAALAPLLAGLLFEHGATRAVVSGVFASGAIIAGVLALGVGRQPHASGSASA